MIALSQNKQRVLYRNLAIAGLGLLTLLAVIARVFGVPVHAPATAVVIASLVLSLLQFRALDEAAKQAHYIAWYWGSLIALALVMLAGVAIATGGLPFELIETLAARALGESNPRNLFLFGVMAGPGIMLLAFAVWWSAHWLRLGQGSKS